MERLGEHYIMDNRGQSDMGWLELFISLSGCVCLCVVSDETLVLEQMF